MVSQGDFRAEVGQQSLGREHHSLKTIELVELPEDLFLDHSNLRTIVIAMFYLGTFRSE